jgi:hypothetical protein
MEVFDEPAIKGQKERPGNDEKKARKQPAVEPFPVVLGPV